MSVSQQLSNRGPVRSCERNEAAPALHHRSSSCRVDQASTYAGSLCPGAHQAAACSAQRRRARNPCQSRGSLPPLPPHPTYLSSRFLLHPPRLTLTSTRHTLAEITSAHFHTAQCTYMLSPTMNPSNRVFPRVCLANIFNSSTDLYSSAALLHHRVMAHLLTVYTGIHTHFFYNSSHASLLAALRILVHYEPEDDILRIRAIDDHSTSNTRPRRLKL